MAIPPGEILAEELEARSMTRDQLAKEMSNSSELVDKIIDEQGAITAERSLQLEEALGLPAEFWLGLQATYDLALARQARGHAKPQERTIESIPDEQQPTLKPPAASQESVQVSTLRKQLQSTKPHLRLAAIKAADELDERGTAGDILHLFQSESDWTIKKACAVALGHLKHRESLTELRKAAANKNEHLAVREWAIWAMGELGTTDEESFFLDLQDSRKLPPALGRVLGGALRKVRLESVRVPKKEIERLLLPPKTADRRLKQIVERLEDIRLAAPGSVPNEDGQRLSLRKQLQAIDKDYLKSYMDWLSRLPDLEKGLENKNSY